MQDNNMIGQGSAAILQPVMGSRLNEQVQNDMQMMNDLYR